MTEKAIHKLVSYSIAAVWVVNGLVCKVLNLVPRHQQIVAEILGAGHSRLFAIAIGCSEIITRIVKLTVQIIVTEHLRDVANFLAFNIGFLHYNSIIHSYQPMLLRIHHHIRL